MNSYSSASSKVENSGFGKGWKCLLSAKFRHRQWPGALQWETIPHFTSSCHQYCINRCWNYFGESNSTQAMLTGLWLWRYDVVVVARNAPLVLGPGPVNPASLAPMDPTLSPVTVTSLPVPLCSVVGATVALESTDTRGLCVVHDVRLNAAGLLITLLEVTMVAAKCSAMVARDGPCASSGLALDLSDEVAGRFKFWAVPRLATREHWLLLRLIPMMLFSPILSGSFSTGLSPDCWAIFSMLFKPISFMCPTRLR